MNWDAFFLSIRVSLIATVLVAALGIAGAYVLARSSFRGRGVLEAIASLPIVLPPTVLGYYLLVVLGRNSPIGEAYEWLFGRPLVFTWQGAVAAAAVASFPYCLRTARAAIDDVDRRFEEAARTIGFREWRVVLLITLPLARRGIIAGVALGFARALGDFGTTLMVAGNIPGRTETMPLAIYDAVQAGNDATALTLSLILSVVAAIVLVSVSLLDRPTR